MNTGDGRSYNAEFSWFEVESVDQSSLSSDFAYRHSWIESASNPAISDSPQPGSDPSTDQVNVETSRPELSEDHFATMSLYPLESSGDSGDDDGTQSFYPQMEVSSTNEDLPHLEDASSFKVGFDSDISSEPSSDTHLTSSMDSSQMLEIHNRSLEGERPEEHISNLSTQEVWNRLSRVAALGLRSGEALKPCPTLVEQDVSSPTTTTAPTADVQAPSRPIDTYNEVQGLLEGLDDLKPNTDIGSRIGNSNQDPRPSNEASEDLENHPFFTTMELKNKVFEQTGQFGEEFEKSTTKLEKQGWDPKSDDLIVSAKRRWGLKKH